jgi:hypothetical protein
VITKIAPPITIIYSAILKINDKIPKKSIFKLNKFNKSNKLIAIILFFSRKNKPRPRRSFYILCEPYKIKPFNLIPMLIPEYLTEFQGP